MSEISVVKAAQRALQVTARQLIPVRIERWFALGFVAFLEQCGRGGGWNQCNIPSPGGTGQGVTDERVEQLLAFMAGHVGWVVLLAALSFTLLVALVALVTWLNSRGTFIYLDNVATGRADIGRPWREHAERAGSYFAWNLGLNLVTMTAVLLIAVPIVWSVLVLTRSGATVPVVLALVASVLAALVLLLLAALLGLALRDFAAPLQWYEGASCGKALRLVLRLLAAHPAEFLIFVLLKGVFVLVAGTVTMTVGCLTCCLAFLPVLQQTLLQPLFYFERRWSLELLAQLGHPLPPALLPAEGPLVEGRLGPAAPPPRLSG